MGIYEMISTVTLCITALVAIASFIVPIIVNNRNNTKMDKRHSIEMEFKEKKLEAEKHYQEQKLEAEKRYQEQKLEAEKHFNEQKYEAEKRYERKKKEFERLFDEQFKIINDFDTAYSEWKLYGNNDAFIQVINSTSAVLKNKFERNDFDRLVKCLLNNEEKQKIKASYEYCREIIFSFLGFEDTDGKNVLVKEQLQKAICKKLDFDLYG